MCIFFIIIIWIDGWHRQNPLRNVPTFRILFYFEGESSACWHHGFIQVIGATFLKVYQNLAHSRRT